MPSRGRSRGGVYLIRARKPSAFLGIGMRVLVPVALAAMLALYVAGYWWPLGALFVLFSGRHNAYVGMTNSFYHRKNQHLLGDVVYGQSAKPWADLEPRFYKLLRLPPWITHKGSVFRGRWTLETLETVAIWLCFPVYNYEKQPPYNLRKISLRKAQQQRWARQKSGMRINIGRAAARWALALVVFVGAVYSGWEAWM